MKRFMNKKFLVVGVVVAVVLGIGGAAFAIFTTTGGGTGSAAVGTNAPLVINQTGVTLYNSTIGLTSYTLDQCLQCVQADDFGNTVSLESPVLSNDLNVVVAMRSWDAEAGTWPITLTIDNPGSDVAGASPGSEIVSDTQYFAIPAANAVTGAPTPFNITFDQFTPWVSIPAEVAYDISFPTTNYPTPPAGFDASPTGFADGLNILLSNAATDITAGSDPYPGTVLINTSDYSGFQTDAGTCVDPTLGTFSLSNVWCGDTPADNYGAYGNSSGQDIPAVEFIDTANGLAGLYPGGPAQTIDFTVYNPGATTEALNSVSIAVAYDSGNGYVESTPGDTSTDVAGCYASWFSTTPETWSGGSIASGQTVDGSGTVSMPSNAADQDACQGATLGLVFSAS
jgi:hypothetical protein